MLATTIHKSNTTPHHQSRATTTTLPSQEADPTPQVATTSGFPQSGRRGDGLVVSKPNSVSGSSPAAIPLRPNVLSCTQPAPLQRSDSSRLTPPQRECFSWCSLERR